MHSNATPLYELEDQLKQALKNRPQPPSQPYFQYQKQNWNRLRKENPEDSMTQLTKRAMIEFQSLPEKEQIEKEYQEKYEEYLEEKKKWKDQNQDTIALEDEVILKRKEKQFLKNNKTKNIISSEDETEDKKDISSSDSDSNTGKEYKRKSNKKSINTSTRKKNTRKQTGNSRKNSKKNQKQNVNVSFSDEEEDIIREEDTEEEQDIDLDSDESEEYGKKLKKKESNKTTANSSNVNKRTTRSQSRISRNSKKEEKIQNNYLTDDEQNTEDQEEDTTTTQPKKKEKKPKKTKKSVKFQKLQIIIRYGPSGTYQTGYKVAKNEIEKGLPEQFEIEGIQQKKGSRMFQVVLKKNGNEQILDVGKPTNSKGSEFLEEFQEEIKKYR